MVTSSRRSAAACVVVLVSACAATPVGAAVSVIGPGAFPPGSLLVDLSTATTNAEVNGLSIGGLSFSYSLGNGNVIIDGGPGITNNVAPQNIVSTGNPAGILSVTLPGLSSLFGFGYALLATAPVTSATMVTLFNGVTNVGSLSYNAVPDPTFSGGFAGIQSTLPFNRVALTFNTTAAPAWAVDNFRVTAVPEPSSWGLLLTGGLGLWWRRHRAAAPSAHA